MKKCKKIFATVLTVLLAISLSPVALATEGDIQDEYISFSGLTQLGLNEHIEQNVVDSNGNRATVGIERVTDVRSVFSTGSTWRVWYTGVTLKAEFFMTVSENRVTNVYNDSIAVVGGSYKNDSLTMSSTYGKLSFTVTTLGGIVSGECWLRGDVTGSDNEINVTWQM